VRGVKDVPRHQAFSERLSVHRRGERPPREMTMHKNDGEFRTLFGKLYVWHENEAGNMVLISVEHLERVMSEVAEKVAAITGARDA
jgi:hypothetical protein